MKKKEFAIRRVPTKKNQPPFGRQKERSKAAVDGSQAKTRATFPSAGRDAASRGTYSVCWMGIAGRKLSLHRISGLVSCAAMGTGALVQTTGAAFRLSPDFGNLARRLLLPRRVLWPAPAIWPR